jgi:DNA repair protein RecN (Recombination protein N)
MLTNLSIKNIAVIKSLDLEVPSGMCVLTGETGAGKSIIIDSINMILGARTNKSLVRYGETRAIIQAVFDVDNDIKKRISENGIDAEDNQVIITREITCEGKSICRINGIMVSASVLRELNLIDIHGQHDNQALLTPSKHIIFLDKFAQNETEYKLYKEQYNEYINIKKEISELNIDEQERIQKIDLLKYQIAEIENAHLMAGEEESLEEQRVILENAEKIMSALEEAYQILYDSDNGRSAYDSVSAAQRELSFVSAYDNTLAQIENRISDVMYTIDDCAHEVYDFMKNIDYNEASLNEVEERLSTIAKLKRKYGNTTRDIIAFCENAKKQLNSLSDSNEQLETLEGLLSEKESLLSKYSEKLYNTRKKAGDKLKQDVENALSQLDMPNVKFMVLIEHSNNFSANGSDNIEFMICTNPGEPIKPLVQIASGGELSRIMLAIKSILADIDSVDTLIFDEIDTGVSGSAAQKIALHLMKIARRRQVICISHLPQIASYANHQFLIEKQTDDKSVSTFVYKVEGGEREKEIARMIDGNNITETSIQHSRQMMGAADRLRETIW